MELYIYETPRGTIADFRSYLDGRDHSFEDHRKLKPTDPRWEKIRALRDPVTKGEIREGLRYAGKAETRWRELMVFPIAWNREFDAEEWEADAADAAGEEASRAS